jgi:transitional endoplasmic reticulum ATPase
MGSEPIPKSSIVNQAEASGLRDPSAAWDALAIPQEPLERLRSLVRMFTTREYLRGTSYGSPSASLQAAAPIVDEVARVFAHETGCTLLTADVSSIASAPTDQEAVRQVAEMFARARAGAPSILLFQPIDQIAEGFQSPGAISRRSREVVTQFLVEIGINREINRNVLLVVAAAQLDRVEPSILYRMAIHIVIPAPEPSSAVTPEMRKGVVPPYTTGADGSEDNVMGTLPRKEFQTESNLWEDLVLPPSVREQLRSAWCAVRDTASPNRTNARGIGILLWGPPGTGKTTIMKAFGDIPGVQSLRLSAADFRGRYLGQTSQIVREVFSRARRAAPSVMCIDMEQGPYSDNCLFAPLDSADSRDSMALELLVETRIELGELRRGDLAVSLVGEIFAPDRLDPAILSRMEIQIEIPLLDEAGLREMLRRKLSGRFTDPALDIEEISAWLAKGMRRSSGRDVENVVRGAFQRAIQRAPDPGEIVLTREDLLSALDHANAQQRRPKS